MNSWTLTLLIVIQFQTHAFSTSSVGGQGRRGNDASVPCRHERLENVSIRREQNPPNFMLKNLLVSDAVSPASKSISSALSDSTPAIAGAVLKFYANLDNLYDKSIRIKCPFFRRRAADLIDNAATVGQFLLIRHKSLPFISDLFLDDLSSTSLYPLSPRPDVLEEDEFMTVSKTSPNNIMDLVSSPPGCKPLGAHIKRHPDGTSRKKRNLSVADVTNHIHNDWTGGIHGQDKGYYITGKLESTIYKDDCVFDGPDPDMPVRGLRKYLNAASHLFDPRQSNATLLSITSYENGGKEGYGIVEVTWRLGGVIQLPWHPFVEPWTGTTRYHLNEEGLIYLHEETWDISVWRAFLCTLIPEAKNWRIWNSEGKSVCGGGVLSRDVQEKNNVH